MVGLFNSKAGQDRSERESTPRASSASNQRLSGGRNPRKSLEVKSRMRRESSLHASDSDNLTSTPSWDAETRLLMLKASQTATWQGKAIVYAAAAARQRWADKAGPGLSTQPF